MKKKDIGIPVSWNYWKTDLIQVRSLLHKEEITVGNSHLCVHILPPLARYCHLSIPNSVFFCEQSIWTEKTAQACLEFDKDLFEIGGNINSHALLLPAAN